MFAHVLRAGMWRGESWQVQLRVRRAGAADRVCVLCFFLETWCWEDMRRCAGLPAWVLITFLGVGG